MIGRQPWQVLTVPGYTNSGPLHWMTRWEEREPEWRRVQQRDWDAPEREEWLTALVVALEDAAPSRGLLVAHSLGCLTIVHAAARVAARIAGAFLVAPADVEQAPGLEELRGFGPVPRVRLPFPSCVIASTDDPYLKAERAVEFAQAWGADLRLAGPAGHLNTASGLGHWPEGRAWLAEFSRRLG